MTTNLKEVNLNPDVLETIKKEISDVSAFQEKLQSLLGQDITNIVDFIIGSAIALDASDIHLEPQEKEIILRFRLDGVLQDASVIPANIYSQLISRIKILSGTKLNITDKPQDGRFSVKIQDQEPIEIRVSIIPTNHGESPVLRILNPKNLIEIKALGLRKDLGELLEKEIQKPHGMILVTGPTGSGKTTTLYAILKKLQSSEIKIITIEDPIEYKLDNITQTQVDAAKGYDFDNGLKSIVRQDPDVILVGEIRDNNTCQTAIQAALTGHLVLSTLHTNDAVGTIARLMVLGQKPSDMGPAINIIIAQRLVRKVCSKCAQEKKLTKEEYEMIHNALSPVAKELELKFSENTKILHAKGCKACNKTGYTGRTGVYEIFVMDDKAQNFILENNSAANLKEFAQKQGMITLLQDGLTKVLEKETTLDEIQRILQ